MKTIIYYDYTLFIFRVQTRVWTEVFLCVHAEQDVVLGTDSQVLANGAELRADVLSQDVGGARGGREQAGQDRPIRDRTKTQRPIAS